MVTFFPKTFQSTIVELFEHGWKKDLGKTKTRDFKHFQWRYLTILVYPKSSEARDQNKVPLIIFFLPNKTTANC